MPVEEARAAFRAGLIDAGLLISSGSVGLYGRSRVFEDVVNAVDGLIETAGGDEDYTSLRFPPVLLRTEFEKTDYVASFPNLTGSVFTFMGGDEDYARLLSVRAEGGEWERMLAPAGVMLVSAACHPAYSTMRGRLQRKDVVLDVCGYCFRHEPAVDPARMQAFRQHEYVYLGDPSGALCHRDKWVSRASTLLQSLGLTVSSEVANDPFFGRAGRMLAANQRHENLKIELIVHLYGGPAAGDDGTAVASSNYHRDHFGRAFEIMQADGTPAHTACIGFGLERIALALFRTHGLDPDVWPASVRQALWD